METGEPIEALDNGKISVSGKLTLPGGEPASHARVYLWPIVEPLEKSQPDTITENTAKSSMVFSDENGVFETLVSPEDTYSLLALYISENGKDSLGLFIPHISFTSDSVQADLHLELEPLIMILIRRSGPADSEDSCSIKEVPFVLPASDSMPCSFRLPPGAYSLAVKQAFSDTLISIEIKSGDSTLIRIIGAEPGGDSIPGTAAFPAPPSDLYASYDPYDGIISLNWSGDTSSAVGYVIYRTPDTSEGFRPLNYAEPVHSLFFYDTLSSTLQERSLIFYRVQAVGAGGLESSFSGTAAANLSILKRPENPFPENGSEAGSLNPVLSWEGFEVPQGKILLYDVYFDSLQPPETLVSRGQSINLLSLSNLFQSRQYFWRIIAHVGEKEITGPVWSFTTKPSPPDNSLPLIPSAPFPADSARGLSPINVILTWEGGDEDPQDIISYDVCFSAEPDRLPKVASGHINSLYSTGSLREETQYFWQIISSDGRATSAGPVWSFTTAPRDSANLPPYAPSSPIPPDGSEDIDLAEILSWNGGDPDSNDKVSYDVLLGIQNPPTLKIASGISATSQAAADLSPATRYYWQVISSDGKSITESSVWSFTTRAAPSGNSPPAVPSTPVPSDLATEQDLTLTLEWSGSDPDSADTLFYQVFLEERNPPIAKSGGRLQNPSLDVSGLQAGAVYFWQVSASDGKSTVKGPVWSFSTRVPPPENTPPEKPRLVSPAMDSPGLDTAVMLEWQAEDADSEDTVQFTLSYGTSHPPADRILGSIASTSYLVSGLNYGTRYYWKVTASDGKESVSGDVWSFVTANKSTPNSPPYSPAAPNPPAGSENVNTASALSWTGGDPDPGDQIIYEIYMGIENPPNKKVGESSLPSFTPVSSLAMSTEYFWRIIARDGEAAAQGPVWSFKTEGFQGTGSLLLEQWDGINGEEVYQLLIDPSYPANPSKTEFLPKAAAAAYTGEEYYGSRMRGYIIPPLSGQYTFFIASDDNSELYLSLSDNPDQKAQIALVPGWTLLNEWAKYPQQQSGPMLLEAGERYYIEVLHKQNWQGNHISVGWQGPGIPGDAEMPIPGHRLIPWTGENPPAPQILQHPSTMSVLEGQPAVFSVQAEGIGPLFYLWYKNGIAVQNSASPSFTTSPAAVYNEGDSFHVTVYNTNGHTVSRSAVLQVTQAVLPPQITLPPSSQAVAEGQTAEFSVSVSGTAPFSYTWYKNNSVIQGARNSIYTTPPTVQADNQAEFRVMVSNPAGSDTSLPALLSVKVLPLVSISSPRIQYFVGESASFSATAQGDAPLSLQWFQNGSAIPFTDSSIYTTPILRLENSGDYYSASVTNPFGTGHSDSIVITVSDVPPAIKVHPASATVPRGQEHIFSVIAEGTNLSYQWYLDGTAAKGAVLSTYRIGSATPSDTGIEYTVWVSNSAATVKSNPAMLRLQLVIDPGKK